MTDTAATVDGCVLARRELSHRLGRAALGFAAAASYLVLIASAGLFEQLVVGVFVPLTFAFERVAQSHVGICHFLQSKPDRLDSRADLSATRLPAASPPRHPEASVRRDVAARITILSVLAAGFATALVFAIVTSTV